MYNHSRHRTSRYILRLASSMRASGSMKSATSLLLGAALATAFFLLYTSVRRDLGDGPARSARPRWTQQEKREDSVRAAADRPSNQEAVVKVEQEKKDNVTSSDGGGRDGSSSHKQKQQQQQIVMPAEQQQVCLRFNYCRTKQKLII
jgi:hypothetical protein